MSYNYIYLIYPGRFAEHNDAVYKIGKSTRRPDKRLSEYENGTEMILLTRVHDCHTIERQIIKLFDELFVKRIEYGVEYYSGDVNKMQNEIFMLVTKDNIHNQTRKEKEIIKVNIESYKEQLRYDKLNPPIILEGLIPLTSNEPDLIYNEDSDDNTDLLSSNVNIPGAQHYYMDFINHIKTTKPGWYKPGIFINKDIIQTKYEEFGGDEMTKQQFHKLFNDKLFTDTKRNMKNNVRMMVARLKKYEDL